MARHHLKHKILLREYKILLQKICILVVTRFLEVLVRFTQVVVKLRKILMNMVVKERQSLWLEQLKFIVKNMMRNKRF